MDLASGVFFFAAAPVVAFRQFYCHIGTRGVPVAELFESIFVEDLNMLVQLTCMCLPVRGGIASIYSARVQDLLPQAVNSFIRTEVREYCFCPRRGRHRADAPREFASHLPLAELFHRFAPADLRSAYPVRINALEVVRILSMYC